MSYQAPTINASGITFAQWQAGGASAHLEKLIAAQAATSNPVTAPTVSVTGISTSGGALAAGGYFCKVTESNGIGETLASPESAVFTVAAGNIPKVTASALQTGNTWFNVYLTPANGAAGSETLYATGVAGTTAALSAAAPTNSLSMTPPPADNSTGLSYKDGQGNIVNLPLVMLRGAEKGSLQQAYSSLGDIIDTFNGTGYPATSYIGTYRKLRHFHTVFLTLATLCNEAGVLLDANAGTVRNTITGIGASSTARSWP